MSDYKDRVLVEADELGERCNKLSAFFRTSQWVGLPLTDRDDLIEQYNHMSAYLAVLKRRISRF